MQREIVFVLFLACFMVLVYCRRYYGRLFLNLNDMDKFIQSSNQFVTYNATISMGFVLTVALFVSVLRAFPFFSSTNLYSFIGVFATLSTLFLVRYLFFYSFLISIQKTVFLEKLMQIKGFFRSWQYLVALLFSVFFSYSSIPKFWVLIFFLICILGLLIAEIFYILVSHFKNKDFAVSTFHIILYLCTLEILPLLVIFKVLLYD